LHGMDAVAQLLTLRIHPRRCRRNRCGHDTVALSLQQLRHVVSSPITRVAG
jgi:hypothetical protein